MAFPYPISDQLLKQIVNGEHQQYSIDTPESFWGLFLSCFDCTKVDGGRLTKDVQSRLRTLLASQLYHGDNGEIIGSQSTIPLQYAGNSFCLVGVSADPEQQAAELAILKESKAVMPPDNTHGSQIFSLSPNDKSMKTTARNVFVLMLNRHTAEKSVHLGYCLAGGLSSLISPEILEEKLLTPEKYLLAAKCDNASYNPYTDSVSLCDLSSDSYAIKKATATRQMMDKGRKILQANHTADYSILEEIAPNGNKQAFRAQPAATAIPDPSRILRDACPSVETLEKIKEYLDPQVYAHWKKTIETAPPYFINDFLARTEDDDPYDPKRLRFPLSASFIGHLTPEKAAQLPLSAEAGTVGRDNYRFLCISLPSLMRPGLFLYPHEYYLSILSGIAFRFKNAADFIHFMKESADRIIKYIEKGDFRNILSDSNFNKIFTRPDATEEELIAMLKQIAYFDFSQFQADYLCDDKFMESAYMIPKLSNLTQELNKLWEVSLPAIHLAVHKYKEKNDRPEQHGALFR